MPLDLKQKTYILDGAMGTMLQQAGMQSGEDQNDYLLDHPQVVEDIHRQYVEAGSDIIYAPVFTVNHGRVQQRGDLIEEDIARLLAPARKVQAEASRAGREVFVALDMGPLGEMLEPLGDLTFEEYQATLDYYEEIQNGLIENLEKYSSALNSFNRLTCGALNDYLYSGSASTSAGEGGTSFVTDEAAEAEAGESGDSQLVKTYDKARYFLTPLIQNSEFEVRVYFPPDFEVEITDFELWIDNILIGTRMPVSESIRHLTLAKDNVTQVKIRLYSNENFVDDCIIDPGESSGELNVTVRREIVTPESNVLGTYVTEMNDVTGMVSLKVTPLETLNAKKFRVRHTNGSYLGGSKMIDVGSPLVYLGLMGAGLSDLEIELCDESGAVLETGRFKVSTGEIVKKETQ